MANGKERTVLLLENTCNSKFDSTSLLDERKLEELVQGIGTKVFEYVIHRAKEKGFYLIQLTSDKKRVDVIRFYESLGFVVTYEEMKLG